MQTNGLVSAPTGKNIAIQRKRFLDNHLLKLALSLDERDIVKEAIVKIPTESLVHTISQMASSSATNTVKTKCIFCQQNRECHYKISPEKCGPGPDASVFPEGPIDRFCYEKVTALQSFFSTLAKIIFISGAGNHNESTPLMELFRWSLLVRRGLVKAKVLGMSELEYSVSEHGTTERLHILS